MAKLIEQIRDKMSKEGLTPYSLEKCAGLKANAVHNIVSGRSKNPSIHVLQTIARTLNCTVSDLIGENEFNPLDLKNNNLAAANGDDNLFKNRELYIKCLIYFCSLLKKHTCWLAKDNLINCVDEVYLYSFNKGLNQVDIHFAKWFFEKINK